MIIVFTVSTVGPELRFYAYPYGTPLRLIMETEDWERLGRPSTLRVEVPEAQ